MNQSLVSEVNNHSNESNIPEKGDCGSLLELVFIIHGHNPKHSEDENWHLEYIEEKKVYDLALKYAELGILKSQKTKNVTYISLNDFLWWAIKREVGDLEIIKRIIPRFTQLLMPNGFVTKPLSSSLVSNISEKNTVVPKDTQIKNIGNKGSCASHVLNPKIQKMSHSEKMKQKAAPKIINYRKNHPEVSNKVLIKKLNLIRLYRKKNGKEYSPKFWMNVVRENDTSRIKDRYKRQRSKETTFSC